MTGLLVDTHIVLWWLADDPVDADAAKAIADTANRTFVSAASIWEIAIKQAIGKLETTESIHRAATRSGFESLAVTAEHAEAVGSLPNLHRDPFDRLLIAQAHVEGLTVVTRDRRISDYDIPVLVG